MTTTSAAFYLPLPVAPEPGPDTGIGLVYQADHRADAESHLLHQFDDSARFHALVRALAGPTQYLEDQAFAVSGAFDLQTASGDALDLIGDFVGVPRDGRSDVAYRAYIYARILGNTSDGTRETLYEIVRVLIGPDPSVQILPGYPAGHPAHFDLNIAAVTLRFPWDTAGEEPPDVVAVAVANAVALAISGGVSFVLFYQFGDDAGTFYFATGDVEEDSTTQGLADDDDAGSLGGALIGVEERYSDA
jgi:hypothetical protein